MLLKEYDQYDKKIALPFHMAEYKQLEAFLESKARDGLMILYFSPLFNFGYFGYTVKKKYHCCVDVYVRAVTDEVFDSDEFNEYLDACEQCGWTPKAYYKNIIVFYSEKEKRPADLQSDEELTYELLKKTTLRIESRMLLTETLFYLLGCLFLIWPIGMTRDNYRLLNHYYSMDSQIIYLVVIIGAATYILLKTAAHLRVLRALRHNRPLPDKTGAWIGNVVSNVELLFWGFCMIYLCIKWKFYLFTFLSSLLLLFDIGYVLYLRISRNHQSRVYLRLMKYRTAFSFTSMISFMAIYFVMVFRLFS